MTLPRIVNMSMRGDSKMTQPAAVTASAADDSSSAACSPPAARGAAGARVIAPRAHDDLKDEVIYSGESDVSDSRTFQRHPDHLRCLVIRQGHCRTSGLVKNITVSSAVTMNLVVRITMPHHHQLVLPRTSVMTMVRAVVMLTTVVPTEVPR